MAEEETPDNIEETPAEQPEEAGLRRPLSPRPLKRP